jgi:hypothetical protein
LAIRSGRMGMGFLGSICMGVPEDLGVVCGHC